MNELRVAEFVALRATIRQRGTARFFLFWLSMLAWGAIAIAVAVSGWRPVLALLSLFVLASGFEAVRALHVNIERIGRYLQAFYEEDDAAAIGGPEWETAAMAFGQRFPGGSDPLFARFFVIATVLNFLPAGVTASRPLIVASGLLHLLWAARIFAARRQASRQRREDLHRFRQLAAARAGSSPRAPAADRHQS